MHVWREHIIVMSYDDSFQLSDMLSRFTEWGSWLALKHRIGPRHYYIATRDPVWYTPGLPM